MRALMAGFFASFLALAFIVLVCIFVQSRVCL
jgi:hypothetical protein